MKHSHDHKHLTFSDRIYIEQSLYDGLSFKAITLFLGKDPSTISKEVKRSLDIKGSYATNIKHCLNYSRCYRKHLCGDRSCSGCCYNYSILDCRLYCNNFESNHCKKLDKPPYVCNACLHKQGCRMEHHYYHSKHAQELYEKKFHISQCSINLTKDKLRKKLDTIDKLCKLNDLVTPLIKNVKILDNKKAEPYAI